MSSHDDRVVRMGFNNAQFEAGASKTMSTLDKLNEKLKLKGASEGSENLQKSFRDFDFSGIERGLNALEKRFSTMGIVSMNIVNKITDSTLASIKKIEQATLGQIKAGGWARAMNIANAKFQIEGLGFEWQQIEDSINYGVKDTAYGLDAAATAASQLAASGVDFKKTIKTVNGQELTAMHKSLRAISGVAAMTNSSYEDIARIFTTVAGNGRLMGDQLLQLSSRGMNAAAKLAETMHTTEADIRDMVSKGKIDFQTFAFAMDDAFGDHAKEANKTFTGALGNMKAALSRVGEIFASPVINKTNTFFISITQRVDEFKNKLKSIKVPRTFDEISKKYKGLSSSAAGYDAIVKQLGDREVRFGDDFAKMWEMGVKAFSAFVKAIDLSWFDKIVAKTDAVTNKFTEFFETMSDYFGDTNKKAAEEVNDATKSLKISAKEAAAARKVIAGDYGKGTVRKKKLTAEFGEQGAKNIQAYVDAVKKAGGNYEKAKIKVISAEEEMLEAQKKAEREQKKANFGKKIEAITTSLSNLWQVSRNLSQASRKILTPILKAFGEVFNLNFDNVTTGVQSFTGALVKLSERFIIGNEGAERIRRVFKAVFTGLKAGIGVVKRLLAIADSLIQKVMSSKKTGIVLDSVGRSLKNLWTTVKNLGKAIGKIAGAIIKAFAKVFNIDITSVSKGVESFTEKLAKLSEKLIISDATAEKVTKVFTKFFNIVKKGLKFVKKAAEFVADLFRKFKDSDVVELAKERIKKFVDAIANGTVGNALKNSPLGVFLSKTFAGLRELVTGNKDLPDKIVGLFNRIVKGLLGIDWKSLLRLTGIATIFYVIAQFLFSLNKISKMLSAIAGIPAAIKSFFTNLGKAFKMGGKAVLRLATAESIKLIAESLVMVIGAIVAASLVDRESLKQAAAVFVVVALTFGILVKAIQKMSKAGDEAKSVKASIGSLLAMLKFVGAASAMMLTIAGSIVLISIAMAIIQKTGAGNAGTAAIVVGLLGGITLVLFSIMEMFKGIKSSDLLRYIGVFAAISALVTAMAAFMTIVAIIMAAAKNAPAAIVLTIAGSIIGIMFAMALVAKIISKQKPTQLLAASAMMVTIGIAFQMMFTAIGAAFIMIAGAIVALAAANVNNIESLVIGFIGTLTVLITSMALLVKASKNADFKSVFAKGGTVAAIVSLFTSMTWGIKQISEAIANIGNANIDPAEMGSITLGLTTIMLAIAAIIKVSSNVKPSSMLGLSAIFIGISVALMGVVVAITAISRLAKDSTMLKSALAITLVLAGIGAAIMFASTSLSDSKNGALTIIAAMTSIAAVLIVIGHVFNRLKDVDNLIEQAITVGALITVIGGVVALLATAFTKAGNGGTDTMLAVGGSFLLVASSLLILAAAMEQIASIGSGLTTAAISMGIFVGAVAILATLAAVFPTFGDALLTVGKAFLYTGAGAALVGAGFWLISKAVQNLTPHLEKFFTTIEDHWLAALGVAAVIIALTVIITKFVDKLATLLTVIYAIVKDAFTSIAKLLKKGASDTEKWAKQTSNKGKLLMVMAITTICSALLKSSPTLFSTIGKILLDGLDFLAKIAPQLINKVIILLINFLYGLANAIASNAKRIASAVRAVLESIITIILEAFASLIETLAGWLYNIPILGDLLGGALDGAAELLHDSADSITKDIDQLSTDSEKGIKELSGGLDILGVSMDKSGEKTSGLTGLISDYAGKLGLATDAVNNLSDAEQAREKQVDSSKLHFQDAYDNATEVEKARYNEYAKLDDLATDAQAKYLETVQNAQELRNKAAKAKAEYEGMILSDSGDPEAIENARRNWLEWQELASGSGQAIDNANNAMIAAQEKANEYYESNKSILETLVKARNEQKEIYEIINDENRVKDEYRTEALNELSKRLEQEKGVVQDFATMTSEGLRENLIDYYGLRDTYNDILAEVVKGHEEDAAAHADELAEAEANAIGEAYTKSLTNLKSRMASDTRSSGVIKDLLRDAVEQVKEQADSPETETEMNSAADTFISRFRDGLNRSGEKDLKPAVEKNVKTNVTDTANDTLGVGKNGWVHSAVGANGGQDFILGYEDGMDSIDLSSFTEKYMQTNLIDTANSTLGIESPSKEMKKTGKFTMMGLINGLTETTAELDRTTGGIGNGLIKAFSTPLDTITKLMNGEMVYDPSIKPVIDSSNVTRSAASINSAFNTGNIEIGQFSGQLAADINSLRRNDNAIVDELKLLREDINTMSDEISSMQMILDTGVLVGEISSGVDRQLGARSIFKKRGI